MLGRYIRARERWHATRDTNRVVRPFEWGAEFVAEHLNGDDPREAVRSSEEFYALPTIKDYELRGERLTWTSAVRTPSAENNTARARLFEPQRARRAVVVLPQWNADAESHVALCRLLARLGVTSLRLTLPSMRQAVLDARAAVAWLGARGYGRIGIVGTSIGSCTAFLAFAHDPSI